MILNLNKKETLHSIQIIPILRSWSFKKLKTLKHLKIPKSCKNGSFQIECFHSTFGSLPFCTEREWPNNPSRELDNLFFMTFAANLPPFIYHWPKNLIRKMSVFWKFIALQIQWLSVLCCPINPNLRSKPSRTWGWSSVRLRRIGKLRLAKFWIIMFSFVLK